jgi:hypothetical protein
MPMREQPLGVHRVRRGDTHPALAYDIRVDGEYAGWVERMNPGRPGSAWRAYQGDLWPRVFPRPGGYLAAVEWLVAQYRAARATAEPVTVAESGSVTVLPAVVADPFRGEPFADPLAP